MKLSERHKKNEEVKLNKYQDEGIILKHDKINYIINSILKEVKKEDRLIRQILYTCFSVFGHDPLNLAINASSGSGKTYAVKNIIKYFPEWFYIMISGASKKIMYYEPGIKVVEEDPNVFVPASKYMDEIEEELEKLEDEKKITKDNAKRAEIRTKVTELQNEQKYIIEHQRLLISLKNKLFIFQDTPDPELLDTIMPLLSHDVYRTTYKHVQTMANSTKTDDNILEGYPSVIYCQAIDISTRERYSEHVRRFIIANPDMGPEKFMEAEKHAYASAIPSYLYKKRIMSDEETKNVTACVHDIVKKILEYSKKTENLENPNESKNEVLIPFNMCLPKGGKSNMDVSVANKTIQFLKLLPIINMDDRPYLYLKKGDDEFRIPFCIFSDLGETFYVNEFVFGGVKEYILEWYMRVFMPAWKIKNSGNNKDPRPGFNGETIQEDRVILYMNEIMEAHQKVYPDKNSTSKSIRNDYLNNLVNIGYIDETRSNIHIQNSVFYPAVQDIFDNYLFTDNSLKLIKKIRIKNEKVFPSRDYLYNQIKADINDFMEGFDIVKIMDCDNVELTIDKLIMKYYSDPDKYFTLDDPDYKVAEELNKPFLQNTTKDLLDYSGDCKTCEWCNEEIVPENYDIHVEKCKQRPKPITDNINEKVNISNRG